MLSFRSFIVSRFTFRSVFHFELNFVYGMRYDSVFSTFFSGLCIFFHWRMCLSRCHNLLGNSSGGLAPAGSRASSTKWSGNGRREVDIRWPVTPRRDRVCPAAGGRVQWSFRVGEGEREYGGRREKGLLSWKAASAFRSPPPSPSAPPPTPSRHSTRTHPHPRPGLPRRTWPRVVVSSGVCSRLDLPATYPRLGGRGSSCYAPLAITAPGRDTVRSLRCLRAVGRGRSAAGRRRP